MKTGWVAVLALGSALVGAGTAWAVIEQPWQSQTHARAVILHGEVTWQDEMPGTNLDNVNDNYDPDVALRKCRGDTKPVSQGGGQLIVRGPDGHLLAVAHFAAAAARDGFYDPATNTPNAISPGSIDCTQDWSTPTLPKLDTYTISFGNQTQTINFADAGRAVVFRE